VLGYSAAPRKLEAGQPDFPQCMRPWHTSERSRFHAACAWAHRERCEKRCCKLIVQGFQAAMQHQRTCLEILIGGIEGHVFYLRATICTARASESERAHCTVSCMWAEGVLVAIVAAIVVRACSCARKILRNLRCSDSHACRRWWG
jgi:hypothetical protein